MENTATNENLIKLIKEANTNAEQRLRDKLAIGMRDIKTIEAYRLGQILAGCRKYPGDVADVIWDVLPSFWNGHVITKTMTDDEIDRFDYLSLDKNGNFITSEERLTTISKSQKFHRVKMPRYGSNKDQSETNRKWA